MAVEEGEEVEERETETRACCCGEGTRGGEGREISRRRIGREQEGWR